jgi:hypothetical protein
MADAIKLSDPEPMEGHGAYNRSSGVQAAGSMPAVDLLKIAAETAALASAPQPTVIADYGCSEGRNSLLPMGVAISSLRPRLGADRAISVVHTDLPSNDFSALFAAIASDPETYLAQDRQVFPMAVGRSFYQQILPPDVVTLGWSSWAVQWLSRLPCPIPDHVQVAYSRDAEACAAFARQADDDWRTFLLHRAREMRDGARLVVLTMATDDSGDFGFQPLLDMMYATLRGMVQDGVMSADDLTRMAIPTVGRSRRAFAAPFERGRYEGLALDRIEIFHGEDRVWNEFESSRDAQRFGAQWAAFSRASVFPSLAAALDDQSKAPSFMDRLEAGLAGQLAATPQRMAIPLAQMLITKR